MTFEHVVFIVFRDRDLIGFDASSPTETIIGLPLIIALERLKVSPDGTNVEIGIPSDTIVSDVYTKRNLSFDGSVPLIQLRYEDESIPVILDSGARQTMLSKNFVEHFPRVLVRATWNTYKQTGIGSTALLSVRILPVIELSVGDTPVSLYKVVVTADDQPFLPMVYGIIGMDFLNGGFELNLRSMRFSLLNAGTRYLKNSQSMKQVTHENLSTCNY